VLAEDFAIGRAVRVLAKLAGLLDIPVTVSAVPMPGGPRLIAEVPEAKCAVMYLPRRPLELPSPLGCLSVAELSMRRGFCADQAARMTTLASCTCFSFLAS